MSKRRRFTEKEKERLREFAYNSVLTAQLYVILTHPEILKGLLVEAEKARKKP